MWTNENRARYDRSRLRYPSDLTDAEWAHVAPVIPPARRGGNRRHIDEREVVNGLMYILSTGCQWRAIPKNLPARSTLYDYFDLWSYDGTLDRLHEVPEKRHGKLTWLEVRLAWRARRRSAKSLVLEFGFQSDALSRDRDASAQLAEVASLYPGHHSGLYPHPGLRNASCANAGQP